MFHGEMQTLINCTQFEDFSFVKHKLFRVNTTKYSNKILEVSHRSIKYQLPKTIAI